MQRQSIVRLVLFACLALLPAGFAAAGPNDEPPVGPPGVTIHVPATCLETDSSVTVWGHVRQLTGYTYELDVELNGDAVTVDITDTVTTPQAGVDDIEFVVDISGLGLFEDDELFFRFTATTTTTYSASDSTYVVAE